LYVIDEFIIVCKFGNKTKGLEGGINQQMFIYRRSQMDRVFF